MPVKTAAKSASERASERASPGGAGAGWLPAPRPRPPARRSAGPSPSATGSGRFSMRGCTVKPESSPRPGDRPSSRRGHRGRGCRRRRPRHAPPAWPPRSQRTPRHRTRRHSLHRLPTAPAVSGFRGASRRESPSAPRSGRPFPPGRLLPAAHRSSPSTSSNVPLFVLHLGQRPPSRRCARRGCWPRTAGSCSVALARGAPSCAPTKVGGLTSMPRPGPHSSSSRRHVSAMPRTSSDGGRVRAPGRPGLHDQAHEPRQGYQGQPKHGRRRLAYPTLKREET